MAHYLREIERLSAAAGFPSNPVESFQFSILENEIEVLTSKIQAKRQVIVSLDEILEKKKLELKAEHTYEERFAFEVQEDMKKFKQKNMILAQYLSTLDSEDFPLIKIGQRLNKIQDEFYAACSAMIEKAKLVNQEFKKVQELQDQCDQLRQKTFY